MSRASLKCAEDPHADLPAPFFPLSAPQRDPTAAGGRPDGPAGQAGSASCPGRRGGHCWVIVSRLKADFWPTAEDPLELEDLLPGTNVRALNG